MSNKNSEFINDIQGIANLVKYAEEYPKGAVKIGYHYHNASALIETLQDIRIRATVGGVSKSDKLMLQILAGLM